MPVAWAVRRRIGQLRRHVAAKLLPRGTAHVRGLSFTLQLDNWIAYYRFESYAEKEPDTLDWLDTRLADGDVFFDVGSNIGLYTLYAAKRHPLLRTFAFEPEYSNLHLLRDNIILNGVEARIETYSVALGDRTGLSYLHIQDLTPGAALHTESSKPRSTTEAGRSVVWSEGVWVMTLDDFCQARGVWPNAIKIDVDGGESRVLAGATRTLSEPGMRTVLIEKSERGPDQEATHRLLMQAGLRQVNTGVARETVNEVWVRESRSKVRENLQ